MNRETNTMKGETQNYRVLVLKNLSLLTDGSSPHSTESERL